MAKEREKKIVVMENGPYRVQGDIPVYKETLMKDENGYRWIDRERIKTPSGGSVLCRCGKTKRAPFCDGNHKSGFNGRIRAPFDTAEERAIVFEGPGVHMRDDIDLCSWSRFCHTAEGKVWDILEQTDQAEIRDAVIQGCQECPSGRLTAIDPESGEELEPELEQEIAVTQDPEKGVSGPLVVRGGIPVEAPDGTRWEVRNRVTLCRCGRSHNTPFCDARHATTEYNDGMLDE